MIDLIKAVWYSHYWKVYQFFVISTEVVIAFFAIYLLKEGYTEKAVLGFFSILYFAVLLMFLLKGRFLFFKEDSSIFLLSLSIILICFICFGQVFVSEIILISGIVFYFLRDLLNIKSLNEISLISKEKEIQSEKLISVMLLMSLIITSSSYPILGVISDINFKYLFVVIMFFLCFILISEIRKKVMSKRNLSISNVNLKKIGYKKPNHSKVPLSVHMQCLLSTVYNSVSFLGIRFLVPLFLLEILTKYGLSDYVYKVLGVLLSIMALMSIIGKKKKVFNSKKIMLRYYFLGLFIWFSITLLMFLNKNIEQGTVALTLSILALLFYLILQITANFWSIGFIQKLREDSLMDLKNENSYEDYLHYFMLYKAMGGFLGFVLAYLFYSLLDIYYLVLICSVLYMIYGLVYMTVESRVSKLNIEKGTY